MRVLLIEDDQYKAKQIEKFLLSEDHEISIAKSFKSGMQSIVGNEYDFILLDMTIPSFEITPSQLISRTRKFGGRDILNEMLRKEIIRPVIVITQYNVFGDDEISLEELNTELSSSFPSTYLGYVFYNASILDWQENLKLYIDKLKED